MSDGLLFSLCHYAIEGNISTRFQTHCGRNVPGYKDKILFLNLYTHFFTPLLLLSIAL